MPLPYDNLFCAGQLRLPLPSAALISSRTNTPRTERPSPALALNGTTSLKEAGATSDKTEALEDAHSVGSARSPPSRPRKRRGMSTRVHARLKRGRAIVEGATRARSHGLARAGLRCASGRSRRRQRRRACDARDANLNASDGRAALWTSEASRERGRVERADDMHTSRRQNRGDLR